MQKTSLFKPFIKNFLDWFKLKPEIDKSNHKPPLVEEGNIWWFRIGENVGTEISGKGREFFRPVIILKKLSRHSFIVIPCSTKLKEGSWYVYFKFNEIEMNACLNQVKAIDYRRLEDLMGTLFEKDYDEIKSKFLDLFTNINMPLC